jgi:uncharacterized protein
MSFANPPPEVLRAMLARARTIAVVGFSPQPGRPSHGIAAALQSAGYRIVPVRPGIASGLGERAYARLSDVPDARATIDLVDVFRAPEHVEPIVDECLALGLAQLWLQDGIVNEPAAARAVAAGMTVVMDRCIWRDYRRLGVAAERA